MITIYLITNKVNGKTYVGSTKNYETRKKTHTQQLSNGSHHNIHMQRTYNKHGNVFEFSILEDDICPSVQFDIEYLWAEDLAPEYNIGSFGGGDNLTNNPNREAIIQKIKNTLRTNSESMTEEERSKKWGRLGELNSNWKGGISKSFCNCGSEKAVSAHTCSKCRSRSGESNPFHGKTHSTASKNLMSEKMKERVSKGFVPGNARVVVTPKGEFLSLSASARVHEVTAGAMHYRINSESKKWEKFYYKMPND